MKKLTLLLLALLFSSVGARASMADAKIDAAAPDFTVADAAGKSHKLADFKGKIVVLEWYNKDCPYVKKHYGSKNMQKLQEQITGKGVVWLSVISSAPGKQGHLKPADALKNASDTGSKATATLIDEKGVMGKAYGAKTTPHIFIIDAKGVLRYNGAIERTDSANPETIAKAENYVIPAIASLQKGEKVAKSSTKPYGCSVKY